MENQVMVLKDLIKINNDRIEGYKKAAENFKDNDIKLLTLFNQFATESQRNREVLTNQVERLGEINNEGTTMSGKIYRTWMDIKATFGGDDAKGILESCERDEDAAKKAYETAIESGYLDTQSLSVIIDQQQNQLRSEERRVGKECRSR